MNHTCTGYPCPFCYGYPADVPPVRVQCIPHKCPVCEGRGVVPANFYTMDESASGTAPVPCRACNGGGIIYGT